MAQIRTKNTATQPIDFSCQEDFTFFYSLTWFVTDWGQICQKINDMRKTINFVLALLTVGTLNAQWTYETINNSFDQPYKIAYTVLNNNGYAKLENVNGKIVFYITGSYYCDEQPKVDVDFFVDGVYKKYLFTGSKSDDSKTIFITWDLAANPSAASDFKKATLLKVTINETYCDSESYLFTTFNGKDAFEFMIKN